MARLDRLYAIAEELRRASPRPISAATLAERFEVSRRTIERDLDALRQAGVPLYSEAGRRGGQVLLPTDGRVVFSLSADEVTALLLAATSAPSIPYGRAGRAAIDRLLDALPDITRMQVEELRHRVRTAASVNPPARPAVQRSVEEAVRRAVVVNLRYRDAAGVETDRAVEAHGFYGTGDGWYLTGWCRLRDAGRIFRLDRILTARLTRRSIPRRDLDETLGWVPHPVSVPGSPGRR